MPHVRTRVPAEDGAAFGIRVITKLSAGVESCVSRIGMRARSWACTYSVPHWPVLRLTISDQPLRVSSE